MSTPQATLSFSLGIVDALYEVCARCRDPVLRRKALDLLARHPRQECMWSSWSAWKVGKFLLHLEEDGAETVPRAASDIPAERRVSEAWLDFSDKSDEQPARGKVAYKMPVPRATPRFALNPGLFESRTTDESIFTGVVETGTLPGYRRSSTLQSESSNEGSSNMASTSSS